MRPATASPAAVLVAVLAVGVNLRGAIAAVGPVLPAVRDDLGLSAVPAGALTTLPVLCFAVLAPAAARIGRRFGPERAVLAGLLLVAAASGLRVLGDAPLLFAGTVVVGAGMTLGNVLVPVVLKRDLGARSGAATGLHTAAIAAGAALGAAASGPLATSWGWRGALAAGAVPALLAALVWGTTVRRGPAGLEREGGEPAVRVRGSSVAWVLTGVLALQSVLYYAFTAWLPSVLVDGGTSAPAAALAASLFQVLGIAGTLVVPLTAGRRSGQQHLGLAVGALWAVLPVGLLLAPGAWPVWVAVGGLAQGAGISLAFTLVVLRAADGTVARALSGMTQSVGYAGGAAGPLVVGAARSATGGWEVPLVLLGAAAAGLAVLARLGGRPVPVTAGPPRTGGRRDRPADTRGAA